MVASLIAAQIASCGGGGSSGSTSSLPPPSIASLPAVQLSATSPFTAGCAGTAPSGRLYVNAEVEPTAAVNPINPTNIVVAWQQDRWSDGGAQGIVTAASFDTGHTWTRAIPSFSRCAGGSAANGGDYARASDPWLTFAPDGTAYLLSLTFTGNALAAGSTTAMLVARSADGGATWSGPIALIRDTVNFFNDKGSITADRFDSRYVYAVWDRLVANNSGSTFFARTVDGGASWDVAHVIYDPGPNNQTIGNVLLSLPGGVLLVIFTELDTAPTGVTGVIKVMRSTDHGGSWSAPALIAAELPVGTRDPSTGTPVRDGSDLPSAAIDRSGTVYIVWQDSRFSNGQRDAIVLSSSLDKGTTWSQPVRVNGGPAAAAFVPCVAVRDDGLVGVTYYDFRNNAPGRRAFTADYWLATSLDGITWHETHVNGPFSLSNAPFAEGLFLGDYQALVSSGSDLLPVFAISGAAPANPSDLFVAFGSPAALAAVAAQAAPQASVNFPMVPHDGRRGTRR